MVFTQRPQQISSRTYSSGGAVSLTRVGAGESTVSPTVANAVAAVVLKNNAIVRSVIANKRRWYKAGQVLARADHYWLAGLMTRREKPENFAEASHRTADDIKVIVQFAEARYREKRHLFCYGENSELTRLSRKVHYEYFVASTQSLCCRKF